MRKKISFLVLFILAISHAFAQEPGNCLRFDGTNDYVNLPNSLTTRVSNQTALTIEYWFRGTTVQSAVRFQDANGYIVAGWNGMHIISTDGGTASGLSVGAAATDGRWHHVAMTWQKNTTNGFKSYLDGVLVAQRNTANVNTPNIVPGNTVSAGGWLGQLNNAEFVQGSLDDVRIYNVALSQADIINDMYSVNTATNPSSLLASYYMNQGTGGGTNTSVTTLTDSSSNGYHGTLVNFALSGSNSNWLESYIKVVPTGLTSSNAGPNSFTASWSASALGAADSYIIDVATDAAFTNLVSGYVAKNVGNVLTTTVTGLANSTTYYWRVRAEKTSVTGQGIYSATQTATTTFQKPGQALSFDGVDDRAQGVGTQPATVTVEAWIRTNTVALQEIVEFNSSTANRVTEFRLYNSNKLCVGTTGNNVQSYQEIVSNATIPTGKWVHVAYVKSGSTYSLYINGVLDTTGTINYPDPVTDRINIGSFSSASTWNNGYTFNGSIDEVRIWNVARTAAEIQANMYNEISASASGLVHYYNFNSTSGTTVTDLVSTGASPATMTNFALTGNTSNWVESYAMVVATGANTTNVTASSFTANWTGPVIGTVENYVLDVSTDPAFGSFVSGFNALNVGNVTSYNVPFNPNSSHYWRVRPEKASVTGQSAYTPAVTVTATAVPGNALYFDGSDDYVNTNSGIFGAVGTTVANFTIEYWIRPTAANVDNNYHGILGYQGSARNPSMWLYNNRVHCDEAAGGSITANAVINSDKWNHVAWVKTGASNVLYVNGVQVNTWTTAATSYLYGNYYLGVVDNRFIGGLDEVRFWNTSLPLSTIQANMYSEVSPSSANLVHYYKFNNASGTTLVDSVPSGASNGTLLNFALTGTTSNWSESYAMVVPKNYTSTSVTNNSFTANWSASTVGVANSYVLDVATDAGFTSMVSGYSNLNVGNALTYNVTGLTNNTPYYWRVRADKTTLTGQGAYSPTQTVTTVFQKPGQALNFDGSNDFVGVGTNTGLSGTGPFAIETWVRTTTTAYSTLVQQRDSNVVGEYMLQLLTDGTVYFWIYNTAVVSTQTTVKVNDGRWHHIAATREADQSLRIYVDGELASSNTGATQSLNSSLYLSIGKDYRDNNSFFNGSLDELRIWNTGRTQAQIRAAMFDEISPNTPGLVHYYNFNSATRNATLTDNVSTGGVNGTLNNFALTGTTSNWVESYAMAAPLSVTASAITNASFTASWTASAVGTVEAYIVDVATDAAFTNKVSGYNALNVGTNLSVNVTGLEQGTIYYLRVRAEKASVTGQGYLANLKVTTPQEPLNVSSSTTTNTFNLLTNSAITVDPNITINYTHNITGFNVVISSGKQSGDVLSYTGTLPSGITAASYNASTGVLSFTGTTTPANWQTLLRTVTFRAYTSPNVNRTISFSAGSLNSFNNGHYYELVTTTDTWSNSKAAASNRRYLNYTGYLATVSSQAENDYIKQILSANAWMGASDDYVQINAATGTSTYANQAASEGKWYWVTGPEAGTQFANSNTPATPVLGRYNNWYTGEPNNASGIEHYGQFYSTNNGTWNDLPNSSTLGYVVEYGGMPNDIVQTPSYTLTMSVTATPPGNALHFDGTNDYVYTSVVQSNPTNFTLEAWFNTTSTTGGGIVGFNDTQANTVFSYWDRFIWMGTDGKLNFGTYNNAMYTITSPNAYNDGKYHHVAATFGAATGMKLYVDGVLVGTNSNTVAQNYGGYWKIGGFKNWGNSIYFNGTIDEVRIWNTVRTQSEIVNNMLTVLPSSTSGLADYYSFDQGIAAGTNTGLTTLYDATSSVNNGVLSGFALSSTTSNWVESYAMVVPTGSTTAITSSGFTANWTAPALGTVNNYILEVSTSTDFSTYVTGYNNKNVGTATSFTITGLSPATTYYWRVRADKTSVTGKGGGIYQTVLTAKEPINVTSTTSSNTFNLLTNTAVVVDPNITVSYSQNITGFRVSIGTNKQDGDVLAYTGTLPSGVTATAYNSSTGVLAFSGSTSAANWQALLRTVTFRAYKNSSAPRSISFSAGTLNSFSNGHFYEFVTTTDNWVNSKAAAANRTYLNYQGYLATVTSQAENDFIKQILSADAWVGASDDYTQINAATGTTTYANQSVSEGKWYWVTGPEAGTQFMLNNGNANVISGKYANWNSGEPNNAGNAEHYCQFFSSNNGLWNDLPITSTLGYVVEYGGLASDIVQTPSYTVTMNVTATEPANALNFDGVDDYVNIPDANSLDLIDNYTIEAWIKPEVFNTMAGIVSKYQTGGSNGYTLRLTSTPPYTGIDFDQLSTANGVLTANRWQHIAAVKSGSTRTIYINGVVVPATGSPITTVANSDPVRIGVDFAVNGRYFDGNIDEVRIWNVARTQSQILSTMYTPLAPSTANLVSYYNFNQFLPAVTNTGNTTVYDQTTSLNNGTLTNFGLTNATTSNWVESYAMVAPVTSAATSKYSLGFTANWSTPTTGTAEKYFLDVATDANFTNMVSGYSNKDVGNVTSAPVNTNLAASTTYYYRVRADKATVTGTGANSNTTTVTTNPTETLVANQPSDRTSTSFTANWSAPALHNISSYTLDVSTNNTFTAPIAGSPFTVNGLSQSITGLTPNTNYYYRVRVTGYNTSNVINASTIAPFASISMSGSTVCVNGTSPVVTFTGSGSTPPYTFVYTINGGANQSISTTSGSSSVTLNAPTSTAGTFVYALVSVTDSNNGTNNQSGSATATINNAASPSFIASPAATICSNTNATYTTQSGQTNYVWTVPGTLGTDYTIVSGGVGSTSSTVTLKWLTAGSKDVSVAYTTTAGCTAAAATTTSTVTASPVVAAIAGATTTTVGLNSTLTNATTGGVWSSSDNTIASISLNGVVTAIGQGSATISYTVTANGCTTAVTSAVTVNPAPAPTISSVSPTTAVVGATLTINGTNFTGATVVTIGSNQVAFTVVSPTSITVTVPQATGSNLAVSVTTPGGTATSTSPNLFTYNTAGIPTITSFSPTSAGTGQTVVITGTNLLNPSSITFGGTDVASYTVNSATQITVVIGSGTTGTVSVTTPGGTGTKTGFTFVTCSGAPTLYAGGAQTSCTDTPIAITDTTNASNYSALAWSTSGTGTFANNTTANALTTVTYSPSAADIAAGSVTLTLTATGNAGCLNATDTKALTLVAAPNGGTLNGGQSVCAGTNTTVLTLSGNVGTISKWQSASDAAFTADVADISNTSATYTANNLTSTTYYRAVLTNGICAPVYSSVAAILVSAPSVAGSISGATTVCAGTNSTDLVLTGNTGNIQWESSTDNSNFIALNGATTSPLTVTNLSSTTYYRAVVTNGVCSATRTASAAITVNPATVSGTVSGSATVCASNNSTTLTLTGSTGIIQWQTSEDNSNFSNIVNANSATYNVTNLTATRYYRAVVTSGVCGALTSNVAAITVNPTSVAGSISGATTVCAGTNNTVLTLNGATGSLQWQSSIDNANYSDISGATSASYTATNLNATTYYRVIVTSGVCNSATASAVAINVDSASVAGTISGAGAVCTGTNSTELSVTGSNGSIQWQSSTDNTNFTNLVGSTANTYTATNLTATRYYRVVVTNGVCSAAYAAAVTMQVDATSVAGTATGTATVCASANSSTLQVSGNTGNIQWQLSANNVNFTNISGATSASYEAIDLSATRYFRAMITNGVCSGIPTNTVAITVNPASAGGSIAGSTTVPVGTNHVTLTLSGYTGDIVKWQSSTAADFTTGVTDIVNTSTTYSVSNLSTTTYYRALVKSGICNVAYSTVATITVDTTLGGTLSGSAVYCSTTNSTVLTLSGYSGTIRKWQASPSSDFTSNVVDIPNTVATLTVTNISVATYYRAIISNPGFADKYSTTASIEYNTPNIVIGAISGAQSLCNVTQTTYEIAPVTGATAYVWNLPAGLSAASSTGNRIVVNVDPLFQEGVITIKATNACAATAIKSLTVVRKPVVMAILGPVSTCGLTTATYSANLSPIDPNAVYNWTVPAGMTIISGARTSSIVVSINNAIFNSGNISVSADAACGMSPIQYLNVKSIDTPTTIIGRAQVCGVTVATYQTPAVSGASNYIWTVPDGMTIVSGQGTNSITTSIDQNTFTSGLVQVATQFTCGTSGSISILVNKAQRPSNIYGPQALCGISEVVYDVNGNVVSYANGVAEYSISPVQGATSYNWTVPAGVNIISGQGTTSIRVTFDFSIFVAGNIAVTFVNACGTSLPSTLRIQRTGTTIAGYTQLCNVTSQVTYSVPASNGNNFNWVVPSWMSIVSGQGTNSITVAVTGAVCDDFVRLTYFSNCNISESLQLAVGCNLASKINTVHCGVNLDSEFTPVFAKPISGATAYRFRVFDGNTTQYVENNNARFTFSQLSTWSYGKIYTIDVSTLVDGTYIDYGCSCSIGLNSPVSKVVSTMCGTTLGDSGQNIFATTVTGATQYRFEVTQNNNTRTFSTVNQYFNLNQLTGGVLYSTAYTIRVAVLYNGVWSAYGPSCTITTPAPPQPKVLASICGTTLSSVWSTVFSNTVSAATQYRFEATEGNNVNSFVSNTNSFNLMQLPGGAKYNTTYSIRVAAKIGGVWQDYGPSCSVSTPSPTTKLQNSQCGITLANVWSMLYADTVPGATAYSFEVTNGSTVRTFQTANNRFNLMQLAGGAALNTTYSVRVAVVYNGSLQAYGPACSVSTGSARQTAKEEIAIAFDVQAFPNPFADSFGLAINTSSSAEVHLVIYDMLGKMIESQTMAPQAISAYTFGTTYASGIYHVVVTQADVVQALKVVKR